MEYFVLFVKDLLAAIDSGNRISLLRLLASAIPGLVDGIREIVAEQTEDNESYIELPMLYPCCAQPKMHS